MEDKIEQSFIVSASQKLAEIKIRRCINSSSTPEHFQSCRKLICNFENLFKLRDRFIVLATANLHGYLSQRMEIFNCT